MKSPIWIVLAAFVALIVATSDAAGQSAQGGLRGAVKDAQGVIPGAAVTLLNEANGVSRETVTNDVGEYSFPAVEPSAYTVTASVTGYKKFERKGVPVGLQQFVTLDVMLEVGAIEESITVTGESPLVDTSNASTGGVLDKSTLESAPTIGRNVYLMSFTVPTVVASGDTHWNRMQDQTGSSMLSLGGGGVRANNYLIDGYPTTDIVNRSSTVPSIEAIEQVKVQVHTYDAEMGRTGGGTFNAASKSGTNKYHGAGFFQWRPLALSNNQFFTQLAGLPKSDSYWHDFGGGFGGPIIKNKTFFWFAGEAYRDGLPQNGNLLLPTAAERNGDFSGLTNSSGQPITIKNPFTGQPFLGNIIPTNMINPVAQKLINYLPLPTNNQDNGTANYFASDVLADQAQQMTGKVDHHFNDKISLSGFYLWQLTHEPYNNFYHDAKFASTGYMLNRTIGAFVLNNTYVVNSTTVVALRYGWNKFDDGDSLEYPFDVSTLGFNQNFVNQVQLSKYPALNVSGYGQGGSLTGYTGKTDTHYHSHGVNGSITKLVGSHSIKAGADYRLIGAGPSLNYGQSAGTFGFTNTFTGSAMADYMLGYLNNGTMPLSTTISAFVKYYGGYAQDDYRVNSRLTVNYGLRVEHETGLAEENNHFTVDFATGKVNPLNSQVTLPVDPLTGQSRQLMGGLVFAGVDGAPTVQGNLPKVKLSPRGGMVFNLDDKSVIRAGYGMFWAPWNYTSPGGTSYGQFGYSSSTTIPLVGSVPTVFLDNPFPGGLVQPSGNSLGLMTNVGSTVNFVDPNKGAPRVQQYSVDWERELPGHSSISVGYVGSRGDHLGYGGTGDASININQLDPKYQALGAAVLAKQVPNPFFGITAAGSLARGSTIAMAQLLRPFPEFQDVQMRQVTGAMSRYNAAVIELKKRSTGWWSGSASYTYSRLMDNQFAQPNYYGNNSSTNAGTILNMYNPGAEYGYSAMDMPHKLIVSPSFRVTANKSGAMGYLVNGWQVALIGTIQSGFPIQIGQSTVNSFGGTGTGNNFGGGQRPTIVPGVSPILNSDITATLKSSNGLNGQYLNPAAWTVTPAYTFGNQPRTDPNIRTPMRNGLDLAVSKDFATGGPTRMQLRVEIINLTNTPWFATFNTDFGSQSFGQLVTQGNYSRVTQITFRYLF
jgi:hypothetical protein